jgi:hypothetical protein
MMWNIKDNYKKGIRERAIMAWRREAHAVVEGRMIIAMHRANSKTMNWKLGTDVSCGD